MLSRRQINVQRDNVASMCRISVKSLLDYACLYTHVDDDCEEFINFCAVFEQLVSHRLRPYQKKVWLPGQGSPRHFWDVLLENYNRTRGFLFQGCIPNIEAIEAFKSPKAKLRAFVRVALMEKRLSDYMFWLLGNTSLMCESYLEGAILASEEATVLCGDLIGLNAIDFNFCLKGNENELLGPLEINYSAFLKYKQTLASQCSDDMEMMRLSGKDAEEDIHPSSILTETNINDILQLQNLQKNVSHIKEQKDYLEELVRLQERQMKEANAKMENLKMEKKLAEKSWEQEFRTMDACVLELQAELSKLRKQNESLTTQVKSLKQFKQRMEMSEVPLVDMAMGEDRDADKSDMLVQMEHVGDRFSMSHMTKKKTPTLIPPDQRSVISLVSDHTLFQEDTQSMVPLTGSLADVSVSVSDSETKEFARDVTISEIHEDSVEVIDTQLQSYKRSGNLEVEKNMEEISADGNVQDQNAENKHALITERFSGTREQSESSQSKVSIPVATVETGKDSPKESLGGDISTAFIDAEDENQKNIHERNTSISESYVVMEEVTMDAIILNPTQNSEDYTGNTVASPSADSAGHSADEKNSDAALGNSSSTESEKEEEGLMSEPEIVNPSNASSGSSDTAWELLSDSEHGDSRGDN